MSKNESKDDKPVAVGDQLEVEIESHGAKGDGVAKVNGYVLFINNVEKGKSYMVEVTEVGPKFGRAEVI